MPTQSDDLQRIIQAVQERAPGATCPFCRTNSFTLAEGSVQMTVVPFHFPGGLPLRFGGPTMPCAVLVCQRCGNTILLNLMTLGLGDLLTPPQPGPGIPASVAVNPA